jgi:HNH endonuclease
MTNIRDDSCPDLMEFERSLTLECAHIIPHYLGEESENLVDVQLTFHKCANVKGQQKQKTWALLNQFSGLPLHDLLSGSSIDSLKNMLALQHDHHKAFGEMRLWFTESEVQLPITRHWIMVLIYFSILRLDSITFIFWTEAEVGKDQGSVFYPARKDAEIPWI